MLNPKQIATLRNFRLSYHPTKRAYVAHMELDFKKTCDDLADLGYMTRIYKDHSLRTFVLTEKANEV